MAEIVRDFTIGLATLRETDKASIRRSMIENQTSENRKRAIVDAMRKAANKGTTKDKRFYKTLATSLKDTRPGEDREIERMASTADADAKTKNAEANTAEDTSVSEKKAAEAREAKAKVEKATDTEKTDTVAAKSKEKAEADMTKASTDEITAEANMAKAATDDVTAEANMSRLRLQPRQIWPRLPETRKTIRH